MSLMGFDDVESAEYDDGEGAEFDDNLGVDSEAYDEASRSTVARRRRLAEERALQAQARLRAQQRAALAAQRRARAGAPGAVRRAPGAGAPMAPAPAQQQTDSAIRTLDLQTKVQEDSFRSALSAHSKRMDRQELAAVAGVVLNQGLVSIGKPDNAFAEAALRFLPAVVLYSPKRGTGVEGFLSNRVVVGGALAAGLTALGEGRVKLRRASKIDVIFSDQLVAGEEDLFAADVFNGKGALIPDVTVRWESNDPNVVEIDASTGKVRAGRPGRAVITAKVEDIVQRVRVRVTAASE